MSLRAYHKGTREEIEHVEEMRRHYPWDGEHEAVTKEIIKLFRQDS